MGLNIVNKENGLDAVVCDRCGAIVVDNVDPNYWTENPRASEKWLEDLQTEHESNSCIPEVIEENTERVKCPYCGEVVVEYTRDYALHNPNACDAWVEQELNNHYQFCDKAQEKILPESEIIAELDFDFRDRGGDIKRLTLINEPYLANDGGVDWQITYKWGKGATGESESPLGVVRAFIETYNKGHAANMNDPFVLDAIIEAIESAACFEIAYKFTGGDLYLDIDLEPVNVPGVDLPLYIHNRSNWGMEIPWRIKDILKMKEQKPGRRGRRRRS